MGSKSLCITYLLWLIGGWIGLHHFYLCRDRHAFVWWCTFGGVFGLGWFRDLWRIPSYVESANEGQAFIEYYTSLLRTRQKPYFNITRFAGQLAVGWFFGLLATLTISEEFHSDHFYVRAIIVPFAVAVGVHLVGNIGREQVSLTSCLKGSYPLLLLFLSDPNMLTYMSLLSTIMAQRNRDFRRTPDKQRGFCTRVFILAFAGSLIITMWCSFLYFNASVTTEDGETIKLRDSIDNFFNSRVWKDFKETLRNIYEDAKVRGWQNVWNDFVKAMDPEGEENAYQVLGVDPNASSEEITKTYRKLVRVWHPDKHRNKDTEEGAAETFMKIQKAYETLSKIKARRSRKNEQSRRD
ncbi:dnaJ homolog subfamily C member 22-like [Amphiura filiformis]|uniref:dnaJ homolog subfamily C member 22-like n=1 Tax=Amphiura filiformis TaxID=82378 RepID=UPI003B227964